MRSSAYEPPLPRLRLCHLDDQELRSNKTVPELVSAAKQSLTDQQHQHPGWVQTVRVLSLWPFPGEVVPLDWVVLPNSLNGGLARLVQELTSSDLAVSLRFQNTSRDFEDSKTGSWTEGFTLEVQVASSGLPQLPRVSRPSEPWAIKLLRAVRQARLHEEQQHPGWVYEVNGASLWNGIEIEGTQSVESVIQVADQAFLFAKVHPRWTLQFVSGAFRHSLSLAWSALPSK